jgi:hypothetical protein
MVASRWIAVLILSGLVCSSALGQGISGPRVSDSSVGYIDSAIPGDVFRLRFDASFDDNRPTRAEFFYPRGGPLGPGLPEPEPRVNFQELSAYLELAPTERWSAFLSVPVRFLQPEIGPDHDGLSDLDAGFKYAFLYDPERVGTFQFRTYVPTGDAARGLGTRHVSLEPAFLFYQGVNERMAVEGELRLWIPAGGTDFAGDIIRYGLGTHYDVYRTEHCTVAPVLEFVGWTVLGGKETVVPPAGTPFIEDAAGQTIVNIKAGLRLKYGGWTDLYVGYGRALTGDRWYSDTVRVEFRLVF